MTHVNACTCLMIQWKTNTDRYFFKCTQEDSTHPNHTAIHTHTYAHANGIIKYVQIEMKRQSRAIMLQHWISHSRSIPLRSKPYTHTHTIVTIFVALIFTQTQRVRYPLHYLSYLMLTIHACCIQIDRTLQPKYILFIHIHIEIKKSNVKKIYGSEYTHTEWAQREC